MLILAQTDILQATLNLDINHLLYIRSESPNTYGLFKGKKAGLLVAFLLVFGDCDGVVGNLLCMCTYKHISSSCAITLPPSTSSLEPNRVSKRVSRWWI